MRTAPGVLTRFHCISVVAGCDGVHCLITSEGPYGNMQSYEHCKLSGLPDLNHSDPSVVNRLVEWMKWTEQEFKPDGIRFDACHNSLEVRTHRNIP